MIKITKAEVFYVTDERDGDNYWNEWRTNRNGTHWENLMGMSWEEIDPPERLVKEFLTAMGDKRNVG
tara:strand:+ start:163 stop:363 length:201 start_codon:yes stop_codon:yes gene_type:complete